MKTLQKVSIGLRFILIYGVVCFPARAVEISPEVAVTAFKQWLATDQRPLGEALSRQIGGVETCKDEQNRALYHVVSLEPAGFAIVAADNSVEPVIAFARGGHFDPSPANPLGALVGADVRERMAYARETRVLAAASAARAKAQNKWKELTEWEQSPWSKRLDQVSDLRVAPLVQSLWSQESVSGTACYNYYTPPYAPGDVNNYPCGCVATALAQLLRYHQHPTEGVGTGPLTAYVNGVATEFYLIGGDGAGGPYAWTNMPLAPSNPTLTQRQAIGALTADAGIAAAMNYGPSGSATVTFRAMWALVNTFGYTSAVLHNFPGLEHLVADINPNLDAGYPVLLGIGGPVAGHEVVCDGYGYHYSTLYHHLNLGWSGMANAWYALPEVDTGTNYRFTYIDDYVQNVYPTGTGQILSGRVLDGNGRPIAGARITATASVGGEYIATSNTNGIYALVKVPPVSQFAVTVAAPDYCTATTNVASGDRYDNVWGVDFTLRSGTGPSLITVEPVGLTANWGEPARLSVMAAGTSPLAYQWRKDGVDLWDGLNFTGAATPILSLAQVTAEDEGNYSVVVSNVFGSVTSAVASVGVLNPFVSLEPGDKSARAGETVLLSATAGGAPPLAFQWRKDGVDLADGERLSGSLSRSLLLSGLSALDTGDYSLMVSNEAGSRISAVTHLSVADPFIKRHPLGQLVNVDQSVTFSVIAGGTPPVTYQWRKDGANVQGATMTSLVLPKVQVSDVGNYDLVVNNAFGSLTSAVARLTANGSAADPSLNLGANSIVNTFAVQPDGKILVGGYFSSLGGQSRSYLGRITASGALDTTFEAPLVYDPYAEGVHCLTVQPDGKILVGGYFAVLGGRTTGCIRLNTDGTLDPSFDPGPDFTVCGLVVQPDGKLLVGGGFETLCGRPQRGLGRLNPDGTLDTSFKGSVSGYVFSTVLQADGKILIGGLFYEPCPLYGRLNPDGTLDRTFNPAAANDTVYSLARQPDGKIIVGGRFTTLGTQSCRGLGRINPDGTLDTSFRGEAFGEVRTLALQTDGKIIIGGRFPSVNGQLQGNLARLNPDGSLDPTFNSEADLAVRAVTLQNDGKLLAGGMFNALGGSMHANLGRLCASSPAIQALTFDGSDIIWLRSGTCPQLCYATFEASHDGGANWIKLGNGTNIPGGWQLAANSPPEDFLLRARGYVAQGNFCGSGWFVESVLSIVRPKAPTILVDDGNFGFRSGQFGFCVANSGSGVVVVETSSDLVNWVPVATNRFDSASLRFFDAVSPYLPSRFYRARAE